MSENFGPIEFVVILVPNGDTIPAVTTAIAKQFEASSVRLLDAVAISRSEAGELDFEEITGSALGPLLLAAEGITSDEDALHLAATLSAGESALLLAVESTWLKELTVAAAAAGGDVIHADRIPAAIVNAAAAVID
ncbi:hypothetical protein G7068_13950 [Leucobacter viscericola]|uniref:DUF1269 domain-containing protein n=1 Tax=Leucobacter viscericola TaxID=2714935 RepID=A0A6G7XII3_9MICO|nr:DUF6325 family protein [Leucobacter viscericola]QIK64178.1 hypothetical protein G7068_13950 [Leucobacter viscericola]